VRCGTCKEVFDGNAALLDPGAPLVPVATPVETSEEPLAAPASTQSAADPAPALATTADDTAAAANPASDDGALYTLDFDTSFDPFGILPGTAQAEEAEALPSPVSASANVPDLDLDLDAQTALPEPAAPFRRRPVDNTPAFATYLRDSRREPQLAAVAPEPVTHDEVLPAPRISLEKAEPSFDAIGMPEATLADTRQEPSWTPPAAPTDNAVAHDADEPAFVTQGRRREQSGKAVQIALAAGSLFLLLLVLLQVMTTFRNPLAAQFPQFKPVLNTLCSLSGCKVDLPAQIEALAIEQGELQTLAPQTFSYVSLLRNHSRSVQAWPSIELTLDDSDDKPVLRRVITPREYLPAKIDVASGLAPRSEQTVKVYFTTQQAKAAGYHIAIFYP